MACFDESRGTVVLFGGERVGPSYFGDTWEWNGINWTQLAATGPSARSFGGFAFDHVGDTPLLFGGLHSNGVGALGDLWRFSAGTWQAISAAATPGPRSGAVFCSDPCRREILCQGGRNNSQGTWLSDCWVWDGSTWTARTSVRGSYEHSSYAFDPLRRRIVCFGGTTSGSGGSSDTWEWDGNTWTLRATQPAPAALAGAQTAFDTISNRTLLFGGRFAGGTGNSYSADTWEYFHFTPASYQNYGQGCPGTNLQIPRLDTVDELLPWVGEAWSLEVTGIPVAAYNIPFGLIGKSRTSANGIPLPLDLGVIGMPGCFLLMSGDESTTVLPNQTGRAPWDITFPLDLRMVGQDFFLQAAVLDPGVNALGLTVSNAGHARPGLK